MNGHSINQRTQRRQLCRLRAQTHTDSSARAQTHKGAAYESRAAAKLAARVQWLRWRFSDIMRLRGNEFPKRQLLLAPPSSSPSPAFLDFFFTFCCAANSLPPRFVSLDADQPSVSKCWVKRLRVWGRPRPTRQAVEGRRSAVSRCLFLAISKGGQLSGALISRCWKDPVLRHETFFIVIALSWRAQRN